MSPVTRPRRGASKITSTPPGSSGERVEPAGIIAADRLRHALSARPSDRARAEAAVTGLYRRLGEPAPDFVWVPSPAAAYLIHPEHGGTGIAPGRYLVRRQRERAASRQGWRGGDMLVAD